MALLSKVRSRLFSYISPLKVPENRNAHSTKAVEPEKNNELSAAGDSSELEGDTLLIAEEPFLKRKAEDLVAAFGSKRRKTSVNSESFGFTSDSEFEGPTLLASTPRPEISKNTRDADRVLMPPPSTSHIKPFRSRRSTSTEEEVSEIGSLAITAAGQREVKMLEDVNTEKARRYAAATTLPADSGSWSEAEKDLFYRLAFRGFEPMLPRNWMIDFRTLPLSLYANDDKDRALIQTNLEPEFHAIRALQDLLHLGERARDRALSKHNSPVEPEINQRIDRYLSWALTDVGMHHRQRPRVIPVHAISTMHRGQTTQGAIDTLAADLHELARRWRRHYNIHESVEGPETLTPQLSEDEGSEGIDKNTDHDDLPTLYGLLICSSLVMIVTMAADTTPATASRHTPSPSPSPSPPHSSPGQTDPGLRMIATFDFSKTGEDVWNALAIAIVVMKIRNTMLQEYERDLGLESVGAGSMWEEVMIIGAGEKGTVDADGRRDCDPDL